MKHLTTKTKVARAAMTLLVAMLGFLPANANIVTIGNGTSTGYYPLPGYYGFQYDVYLYTPAASEWLDFDGTISSIAYNVSSNSTSSGAQMTIWLKDVDANYALAKSTTFAEFTSEAVQVYYNNNFSSTSGWNTLTFGTGTGSSSSFSHKSGKALLVAVYSVACSTSGGCSRQCYYTSATNTHWYKRQDDTNPGTAVSGSIDGSRANVQLDITFTETVCFAPTGLVATLTPGNGSIAKLNWTRGYDETSWVLEYGTASNFTGATSVTVSGNPEKTLSGLTAEATYYARVKPANDTKGKKWSNTCIFTPTNSYFLTLSEGTGTTNYTPLYGVYKSSYVQMIYTASQLEDADIVGPCAITKIAFNSSAANLKARKPVIYIRHAPNNKSSFSSNTDFVSISEFTKVYDFNNHTEWNITAGWNEFTLDTPFNYDGSSNLIIAVHCGLISDYSSTSFYCSNTTNNQVIYAYHDNNDPIPSDYDGNWSNYPGNKSVSTSLPTLKLYYEPTVSCAKPTNLAVTATTTTSATFSWTNGAEGQNAWQICLNNDETGLKSANSNPFTIEGLAPGTLYTAKVRAYCSTTDQSKWSKEVSFTTQCVPITITENNTYSQGFEGYTGVSYSATYGVVPICWDSYSTGSVAPHIIGSGSSYYYVHNGTQALTFYGSGYCYAALPEFTNSLSELRISFWMQTESATNGELTLGYITAEDVNFNTFTAIEIYGRNSGSMVQRSTYLNEVPATATQLVFKWDYSGQYSCCIDDVEVSLIPSCISPTGLTATDVTATSAKLNWSERGSSTSWVLQYGTDKNFAAGSYIETTVSTNPTTSLTGLTAESIYYARVKPACDTDGSNWSDVISFWPTATVEITLNNGTNTTSCCPFYGFFVKNETKSQFIIPATALEDKVNPGSTIKRMYFYTSSYYPSVDWGDATFKVYLKEVDYETFATAAYADWTTLSNVYSGSLTVSNYMMEIIFDNDYTYHGGNLLIGFQLDTPGTSKDASWLFAYGSSNSCVYSYNNGSVYRYNYLPKVSFRFLQGEVTCERPKHLAVSGVTAHGATLSWESTASAWQIMLNDDANNLINVNDNPTYTFSNLPGETTYSVKVRTKCSDVSFSEWTPAVSFKTNIACYAPTRLAVTPNKQTATFTWESNADGWEVACATNANADPAENIVDGTISSTTTYTAENLTRDTDYYFWVRSNCGDVDGKSKWAGPVSAHIGYCTPNPSSRDGKGITKVVFGTGTDVVNNVDESQGLPGSAPYYGDYSTKVGAVRAGEEATVSITYATGSGTVYSYGTIIWVDWDNSLTFEDSEIVYTGTSAQGSNGVPQVLEATFVIPTNQTTGDYRMRIAGADRYFDSYIGGTATADHSACFSSTYAVCHDYTLRVLVAPICLKPSNVTITPAPTAATVSWEGSNANYKVQYRVAGQETFTSLEVSGTTTATIENLTPSTSYECQVQSVDGSYASDWTTLEVFTTLAANPIPTDIAASNIAQVTATVSWNGFGDSYNVQYRKAEYLDGISESFGTTSPADWKRYIGLLTDDVMNGKTTLNTASSGWYFGTSNDVFDNHAYTNIYGYHQNWLVSPAVTIPENGKLTFNLALTAYNGTLTTPQTTGTDDRFVVLASTDMITWTILRQWDNAGSDYVYNEIACSATGENVSIDLTPYTGQSVYIAFYGESTLTNADNNLHIDNVVIGTSHQASDWSLLNTTDKTASLTNLTANTRYECQVQSVKNGLENSDWSSPATFTTTDYDWYKLTGVNVMFFEANSIKEIHKALEGQEVTVSLSPDNVPDNQYLTGNYLSADVVTFTMNDYNSDATFIMPAKAVTVTAELANQSEYLIDLTAASTQEITYEVFLSLNQQEGYFYSDDEGQMYLDINRDGMADLQVTEDYNEQTGISTYGVTRLDGANQLRKNYRFTIRTFPGLLPSPYSTALVKLNNTFPEENLPVIETLFDNFDNTTDIAAWAKDGKSRNIMLDQRTLYRDGDWNTLCLPFDLTAEEVTAQLAAPTALKTLETGTFSKGVLTLNFKDATTIEAGKPYIVKWANTASNLDNPVFYNVVVRDVRADVTTSDVDFKGTYEAREFYSEDPSVLFLGGSNTLYYPQPTLTDPNKEWSDENPMIYPFIGAFRAYFKVNLNGGTDGVRAFVLNFGDGEESQGIGDAARLNNNEERINNKWYTVDGRKLDTKPTKKGLYIHGGKKVVIK